MSKATAQRAAPPPIPTTWASPRGESGYLRPHRVLDAHDSYAGEIAHNFVFIVPVRLLGGREVPVGDADSAETITSHRLDDLLHHVVPVPRAETSQFTVAI